MAASFNSSDTFPNPAKYIASEKPVICQIAANNTAINASGSPNSIWESFQPGIIVILVYQSGDNPNFSSIKLTPESGFNIQRQMTTVTKNDIDIGKRKTLDKKKD